MYPTDPSRTGGTHAVLPADADKATLGRVVTMFRAPKQVRVRVGVRVRVRVRVRVWVRVRARVSEP